MFDPATGLHPSDVELAATVDGILADLAALDAELTEGADDAVKTTEHLRALEVDAADIPLWMEILATWEDEPVEALDPARALFLTTSLTALGADAAAITQFLADIDANLANEEPTYPTANAMLVSVRRQARVDGLVAQHLAEATGLAAEAAATLANDTNLLVVDSRTVQAVLVQSPSTAFHAEAVVRMHKAARVIVGLGVRTADIGWYFGGEAEAQRMNLAALPVVASLSPAVPPSEHFVGWRRVRLGQELQSSFSTADNAIRRAVEAASFADARTLLIDSAGWDPLDFDDVTANVVSVSVQDDLRDPTTIAKIRDIVALVGRTGVRAADLRAWAASAPTEAAAVRARQALKARHSESSWASTVGPMMDRIREAQRDALVAVILGRGDFADEVGLYEHLLVDPSMNACMLTSRIKLAVSSVQLFIQRSLMALEPDVDLPAAVGKRWSWLKTYRVWEASRKVFFYPENWIEPELRDDKTPFFKELEAQIDQGPIEEPEVERAFADYLTKLHEVAHLDVVALYEERHDGGGSTVHVVGRTRSPAIKHFYRTRIDDLYWTAWEPIEHEINTDQVVLTVRNRRLFLFWLELLDSQAAPVGDGDAGPLRYQPQISWSERREGQWSPRKQSSVSERTSSANRVERAYHFLVTSGADIDVIYDHPNPDDNAVVTTFRYDDCLDKLIEVSPTSYGYSDNEVGKQPHLYLKRAQQYEHYRTDNSPSTFFTQLWRKNNSYYYFTPLIRAASPHRFTITRQDRPHLGVRPLTFDNASHALYVVPTWYRTDDPYGVVIPESLPPNPTGFSTGWNNLGAIDITIPAPGQAPPPSPTASLDGLVVAQPWEGVVPGAGMVLLDPQTLVPPGKAPHPGEATKVLLAAQGIAGADVGLGLTAGYDGADAIPGGDGEMIDLGFRLDSFHHPYTCELRGELNRHGIDGVLASDKDGLRRQLREEVAFVPPGVVGEGPHQLLPSVRPPYPIDEFDFSPGGAYSVYNWELFFHAPLYIAERLRKEQRFEEAMRWYHFIFNPQANKASPAELTERFWNVKPLYRETAEGMPDVIKQVFSDEGLDVDAKVAFGFFASLAIWLRDPFNPHAIARWRPGTYRWVVVQKYLDNLLDWADSLFRRDTIETINEATQLYMLAAAILGPRPKRLPEVDPTVHTYDQLTVPILFGGLVELEGYISTPPDPSFQVADALVTEPSPTPMWWYFCVPPNDQLLQYWDTVADRLYKIRNCQNVDGVARPLALFEPPIDPALLVRARAMGLDLAAVVADLQAPLPHYRYRPLAARAMELVGDVRGFGAALQQALERKDAEALQELRAGHEVSLLAAVRSVREQQVEEAEQSIAVLRQHGFTLAQRREYYRGKDKTSDREDRHIEDLKLATGLMAGSQGVRGVAGIVRVAYPTKFVGNTFQVEQGGQVQLDFLNAVADGLTMGATIVNHRAAMAQIRAGYDRRWEDWQFQGDQAASEEWELDQQILAAEIRLDIAKKELENHDRQVDNAKSVEAFLRTRYTNQELYTWLIGQLSQLYYQSYTLAYDMAKKAERAMQYELCTEASFVGFGHWDSLHKGLFAGERLQLDLRRMEASYLDRDRRLRELTKRVSLRQVDPDALLTLRETGTCEFDVAEVLFDLDHPGHYRRRIKAVSVTIPATVGPHTTLGAKLTLVEDRTRLEATLTDPDAVRLGYGGISSIATSHARGDSGLFTLDFRDERFLPFEGAGAWSRWRLELPTRVRQFDYDTITDVELQIQYTAMDAGGPFRSAVEDALQAAMNAALGTGELALMLSAKAAFPTAWEGLLYPAQGQETAPLTIPIVLERLPHLLRGLSPTVTEVALTFLLEPDAAGPPISIGTTTPPALVRPGPVSNNLTFTPALAADTTSTTATVAYGGPPAVPVTTEGWTLQRNDLSIDVPGRVKDLVVVVRFQVTVPA